MNLFTGARSLFIFLILTGLVLGLQACGGGGDSTPVPAADADPIGYYAGTFSYTAPSQPQADKTVKAIVDSDKFLMVHIDHVTPDTLLYVGSFTDITETTFTADVKIYRNGIALTSNTVDATITNGLITEKSSMSGTLSGSSVAYSDTDFSLIYDTLINGRAPRADSDNDIWREPLTVGTGTATDETGFILDSLSTNFLIIFGTSSLVHTNFQDCTKSGITLLNVNGEQPSRIRKYISVNFNDGGIGAATCSATADGYITSFDDSLDDDRYLWINYNDTSFFVSELTK